MNPAYKLLGAWAEREIGEATWTELKGLGEELGLVRYSVQLDRMLEFLKERELIVEVKTGTSRVKYIRSQDFAMIERLQEFANDAKASINYAIHNTKQEFDKLQPSDKISTITLTIFSIGISLASLTYARAMAPEKWKEYVDTMNSEVTGRWEELIRLMERFDPRIADEAMRTVERRYKELFDDPSRTELRSFLLGSGLSVRKL